MKILSVLLLAGVALTAAAQTPQPVYRSTMPDGRVIYGDKPAPGATQSQQVELPPLTTIPSEMPEGPRARASSSSEAIDRADAEIVDAKQALDQAKAALEAGREPLPGERLGTASGGSRLSDAYFARIQSLENAVKAAQQRLDDAFENRNALRQ